MGSNWKLFLISDFRRILNVVFFILGDFLASEFYVQTFRTHSQFHLQRRCGDGTDNVPKRRHKIQTPWNHRQERMLQLEINFRYASFGRVNLFRGMHQALKPRDYYIMPRIVFVPFGCRDKQLLFS
jgi:hypothetical protein